MTATARTYKSAAGKSGGKRREAAEQALQAVLELFESGELPEKIAQTEIARSQYDAPSNGWSLGNQLLCLLAGTHDARGYRQWQEVGRNVKKGSKALYILAPCARKIREEDAATGEESQRTIVTGFVGVPVFALEDTEGEELPTVDYRPATFPPLMDAAERLGVSVTYLPFVANYRGYYQPAKGSIVLCSHDESVWFHELAHAAHNQVRALRGGQDPKQEIVAETVAAVLCRLYGLDGYLYDASKYVEHYAKGQNPGRAIMRVLADVRACLDVILQPTSETSETPATAPRLELVAA